MNSPSLLREIQSQIQAGTFSCQARVRGFVARIREFSHFQAFVEVYEAEALARALEIDNKIKEGRQGKLAGLVVGLKDNIAYNGHTLQAASKILEGFQSPYSATAVERLLAEDAIIIGRQNCDEFGMGSSNENSVYGPTRNPVDPTRVTGGSSGGSAAAVAAGLCDIALGSDTGGSIRQPAAFCGITGLKPTYSRISRHGLVAYASSFDCIGVLASSPADIAAVLGVIAGPDDYDSTASRLPVPDYTETTTRPFRIAYVPETLENEALQSEIRAALRHALDKLRSMGHTVEAVSFPLMEHVLPAYYILVTAEASSNLSRYDGVRFGYRTPQAGTLEEMYKRTRSEGFGPEVRRRILLGTFVLSSDYYDTYYAKAQKVRAQIRAYTTTLLSEYDFLLTPTAPTTAFPLGSSPSDPVASYLADLYSVHANVAGVPAISFPYGKDASGLPIGLQALAGDFREGSLLQLAALLAGDL